MGRDANLVVPDTFDVEDVLAAAAQHAGGHGYVATVCLFSGGGDSGVLAHRCRSAYDELVFIDTGTAVPGVREHVVSFAKQLGKPLRILEAGEAWRDLVLKHGGFPGPAGHARAFTRLKERQIDAALRLYKAESGGHRNSRVLFLTGKRRAESSRRSVTTVGVDRTRAKVFANPLVNWSNERMRAYRTAHALPISDPTALCHRSMECNCGAFAAPGEREMLQSLWPVWFEETIASLEREAAAAGIAACVWGLRPPPSGARPPAASVGALCSSCDFHYENDALA